MKSVYECFVISLCAYRGESVDVVISTSYRALEQFSSHLHNVISHT